MLKRNFDSALPYKVVLYLRMSSDKQNPRSPDQQEFEIRQKIKSLGLSWSVIKVYRDDGVSGRYERKRTGYQKMLNDIRSGMVKPDLILVDTSERFGRNDNLEQTRRDLRNNHGVYILTAESNFSDPTTPQGKLYGAFESVRATEENRIKSYQVSRGKRDLAKRGYWPGGLKPFGLKYVSVIQERNGMEEKVGTKLKPHPEEAKVISILFQRAVDTGHSPVKLTRYLNQHPDIPSHMKPFNSPTVRSWLKQPLYRGELVYNVISTDVINDVRVIEKNPESDWIRFPGFCEAIISEELWDSVQAMNALRCQKISEDKDGKLIKPLVQRKSLVYPLSGLVRCALCGASMRPMVSGQKNKAGGTYCYYACPRYLDRICENGTYIPEKWLRERVIDFLKKKLFPGDRS